MILIADAGSTKINWCLIDENTAETVQQAYTPGMNAVMLSTEEMSERFQRELPAEIKEQKIDAIYFYGAGCINATVCGNVSQALLSVVRAHKAEVYSDLLAAARALCGHRAGIACILGTGSNSCLYDGEKIVDNVSPLGYILGDEGSGAVIGKLFIGDLLKNQLPKELSELFLTQYKLDRDTVIRRVYREPLANRFLATFMPFIHTHIETPQLRELVLGQFRAFIRRNIMQYSHYKQYPLNFIGSIGYYFHPLLDEAAAECGCRVGTILQSPMEGLIKYHSNL